MKMTAAEALADAWASIDGKLDVFQRERDADRGELTETGTYEGYLCEAVEMIERIHKRGFVIIPIEPDDAAIDRMARAIFGLYRGEEMDEHLAVPARAAYAAIVTAPSSEK